MKNKIADKEIELIRYNKSSGQKLLLDLNISGTKYGSMTFPKYLQSPYIFYEKVLAEMIKPEMDVLDLCCGDGIHTFPMAKYSATITAVDISPNSIELCKKRASVMNLHNVSFQLQDIEKLDYPENSFDIVTMVGSLSYTDLQVFFETLKRIIKPDGHFICVDSLNENPFYRFNRYLHYLKGHRSASTLKRMPDMKTVNFFRSNFNSVDVQYFGIFMFLAKFLTFALGESRSASVIEFLDRKMYIFKRYAFKFVLIAGGIKK